MGHAVSIHLMIGGCTVTAQDNRAGRATFAEMIAYARLAVGACERLVPILLQKSLMPSANSDSVALMRFAAEAGDDGAAQSRPRAAVIFVFS